ncbi:hypothetical protein BCR34DRAFT_589857 [Clohesyomyces aquaticus]|uniref:Uncharacterized protein n=1 Tax=Clohesyomyces aquaticus TaxID=1231657 RepID=A0A1Y1ZEG5_9PLEO|nr:hypothetical protein BCR34DRAFT_589857 [Clohesyomyces aquaticus]
MDALADDEQLGLGREDGHERIETRYLLRSTTCSTLRVEYLSSPSPCLRYTRETLTSLGERETRPFLPRSIHGAIIYGHLSSTTQTNERAGHPRTDGEHGHQAPATRARPPLTHAPKTSAGRGGMLLLNPIHCDSSPPSRVRSPALPCSAPLPQCGTQRDWPRFSGQQYTTAGREWSGGRKPWYGPTDVPASLHSSPAPPRQTIRGP